MDGKHECPVCGGRELLRAGGVLRAHYQMRVGVTGPYRSKVPCGGAGEKPVPVEELAGAAAGGA